jgi:hypothetical protein
MRNYREVENLYDQLEAILSTLQLGDVSSDHRAELEGFRGWNYVAISAVAKQATRSLIYVYDDVDPSQKAFRKSMRLTHGSQWRKAVVREHQGQILDSLHPLVRLLHRPNPYQSGGSFRWEQLQQLRLHGSCIVFNRPNIARTRTVQRYVVPLALITPIKPSIARGMPRGGITIHPSSATVPSEAMLAEGWGNGLQQFFGVEIPVEMLTIIKYPHPYLRGDGASPTGAASHWIDAGSMIDASRAKFYAEGPNGKMLISADVDSPSQVQELEERLSRRLAEDGPRVTIIGNGATIATKRTADEMAYDVGHDQMRDAVLASHGVPKAMVGHQDGMTYSSLAASLLGATMLSIQPDMDLIADEETVAIGKEYGPTISIEYEVPAINDPELEERRLAQDAQLGVITVGEYRQKRGEKPFGTPYDHWLLTARGPVDPASLVQQAGAPKLDLPGQLPPWEDQPVLLPSRPQGSPSDLGQFPQEQGGLASKAMVSKSASQHPYEQETILVDETLLEVLQAGWIEIVRKAGYRLAGLFQEEHLGAGVVWDWSIGPEVESLLKHLPPSHSRKRLQEGLLSCGNTGNRTSDGSGSIEFCLPKEASTLLSRELQKASGLTTAELDLLKDRYAIRVMEGILGISTEEVVRAVCRIEAPYVSYRDASVSKGTESDSGLRVEVVSQDLEGIHRYLARNLPHRRRKEKGFSIDLGSVFSSTQAGEILQKGLSLAGRGFLLPTAVVRMPGEPAVIVPLRPPPSVGSIDKGA